MIAISYLVVVILGVAIAAGIAWSTVVRPRLQTDPRKLAERERIWLVAVLAVLATLLFATIFFTPYGQTAPRDKQVVEVVGRQFFWEVKPSHVKAGKAVEFRVRSVDVNHGLGLYSPGDVFLKQIQVLPDRESRMYYTFHKPGVYKLLCLEFCGLDHHLMKSTITVTR